MYTLIIFWSLSAFDSTNISYDSSYNTMADCEAAAQTITAQDGVSFRWQCRESEGVN